MLKKVGKFLLDKVRLVIKLDLSVPKTLKVISGVGAGCSFGYSLYQGTRAQPDYSKVALSAAAGFGCIEAYKAIEVHDDEREDKKWEHEERQNRIKHPGAKVEVDNEGSTEDDSNKEPWHKKMQRELPIPQLPAFLDKIMVGVPKGYEAAMLIHLNTMLGALCFSKIRARYLDGKVHAPNLMTIVEGNWGAGKGTFETAYKELFSRIIERDKNKMALLDIDSNDQIESAPIIQTIGLGTSMSMALDFFANSQGTHLYLFNSEVRALANDLRKGNGLNFDVFRKAFENGDVCRLSKAKNSKNGIFPAYLNFSITGTPADIQDTFKKELEGGTLSRICWAAIPEQGREPSCLVLPKGKEMESLRDKLDGWQEKYCHQNVDGMYVCAEEHIIDLDYVSAALKEWASCQYDKSESEGNPARSDVRLRIATMAFHHAMVLHMICVNKSDAATKKIVTDLTLYIANYCMERFLFKFGKEQNEQRRKNQEAELVDAGTAVNQTVDKTESQSLITDIGELARLHEIKDEEGKNKYGLKKLVKMSGIAKTTLKRRIEDYNAQKEG